MSNFGTINYAGTDWEVVSFVGASPGMHIVMYPNRDVTAADVIAEHIADEHDRERESTDDYDAAAIIAALSDAGYAIVATRAS